MTNEEIKTNVTREEEIKQAATQIAKEWYCGPEDEFHYEVEKLEEMGQWADEHPKNPWISVEDRLPEVDIETISANVFVRTKGGASACTFTAHYDHKFKDWYIYTIGFSKYSNFKIAYWMPIPEVPKGGAA